MTNFRGTKFEGVIIQTLAHDGTAVTDQGAHVTVGLANYGAAVEEVHLLRSDEHREGGRGWWLPFQAADAVEHLRHYGHTVPAELLELTGEDPAADEARARTTAILLGRHETTVA